MLDRGVEHVFVDKADIIEVKIVIPPGSTKIEIYTDEQNGISINSSRIEYLIKEDNTFLSLDSFPADFRTFYGTYNSKANIQTDYSTIYQLEAVYYSLPR